MNNFVADIIIVVCCMCVGLLVGRFVKAQYVQKRVFFADLCRYIAEFTNNINGRQIELGAFDDNYSAKCSDVFAQYLCDGKLPKLSAEDKSAVGDFFAQLNGATSSDLLIHLQSNSVLFGEKLDVAKSDADKSAVYPKLGVLLGLMVGILLI